MSEAREVWQEPDYKGMIPKLEQAHIEINQLRYKIQEGGLKLQNKVKSHDGSETTEVTERERRALLGMLIAEGNKRLKELSDVKSYLVAVEQEGMLKVSSGYIMAQPQTALQANQSEISYLWSPSGIKYDCFVMYGTVDTNTGQYTMERNHDEIEDSMLLSIDFDEIEDLFQKGAVPY